MTTTAQPQLLGAYLWGTYNPVNVSVQAAPMYRQHIENICFVGGSHARDLAVDVPGSVWIAGRFAGESLFEPLEPNAAQRYKLIPRTPNSSSGKEFGSTDYIVNGK
jgi:hypothetical protein